MGNAQSAGKGDLLACAAVARYMSISRDQILGVRDVCLYMADNDGMISRRYFHLALTKQEVNINPDGDVLDCLFTMLDDGGEGSVDVRLLLAAISPMACPEGLDVAIKFAIEIIDFRKTKTITEEDLLFVLNCMATTSNYFGDTAITPKLIRKIVDGVFGTITGINEDSGALTHEECFENLMDEPIITKMQGPPATAIRPFSETRLISETMYSTTTDGSSIGLTPFGPVTEELSHIN